MVYLSDHLYHHHHSSVLLRWLNLDHVHFFKKFINVDSVFPDAFALYSGVSFLEQQLVEYD